MDEFITAEASTELGAIEGLVTAVGTKPSQKTAIIAISETESIMVFCNSSLVTEAKFKETFVVGTYVYIPAGTKDIYKGSKTAYKSL